MIHTAVGSVQEQVVLKLSSPQCLHSERCNVDTDNRERIPINKKSSHEVSIQPLKDIDKGDKDSNIGDSQSTSLPGDLVMRTL
jgi:hypothetical protein